MNYLKAEPGSTSPGQDEPGTPAPAPEVTPKRRRFIQPTFSNSGGTRAGRPVRMVLTGLFAACLIGTQAQTDNTNRMNPDQARQGTDQGQGTPQNGWSMFDDRTGRDFKIDADQLQRLREVDSRYAAEYGALGTDPMKNPGYRNLTDRRNNDIRGILSTETYVRWEERYGGTMNGTNTAKPEGTAPETGSGSGTGADVPKNKTTRP